MFIAVYPWLSEEGRGSRSVAAAFQAAVEPGLQPGGKGWSTLAGRNLDVAHGSVARSARLEAALYVRQDA